MALLTYGRKTGGTYNPPLSHMISLTKVKKIFTFREELCTLAVLNYLNLCVVFIELKLNSNLRGDGMKRRKSPVEIICLYSKVFVVSPQGTEKREDLCVAY